MLDSNNLEVNYLHIICTTYVYHNRSIDNPDDNS